MTTADDVIQSFESTFADKTPLPDSLVFQWLKKAIARYSMEIDDLTFDVETKEFSEDLDQYVIDTMAEYMHQYYQERYYSLVNKRVSIVTKELSIDGNNGSKTSAKNELDAIKYNTEKMTNNQKPTAYT